jgi:hypothetical protein
MIIPQIDWVKITPLAHNAIKHYKENTLIKILNSISEANYKHLPASPHLAEDFYSPIHNTIFKKITHTYGPYISFLEVQNIIEISNFYIPSHSSLGYRITFQYSASFVYRVINRYKKVNSNSVVSNNITKNNNTNSIFFTKNSISDILDNPSYNILAYHLTNLKINLPPSPPPSIATNHLATLKFNMFREKLAQKEFYFQKDKTGFRFHSPITNLNSTYRKYITYNDLPLHSIDIKNSQPYLLKVLLNPDFYLSQPVRLPFNIQMLNPDSKFSQAFINKIQKLLLQFSRNKSKHSDIATFTNLVETGTLYEHLYNLLYHVAPTPAQRKEFKTNEFFTYLYSNLQNKNVKPLRDIFITHFPSIHRLLTALKFQNYKLAPILLQRIEAYIVLDVIIPNLITQNPDIPLLTLHDSIISIEPNIDIIKSEMESTLLNYIGAKPTLDVSSW